MYLIVLKYGNNYFEPKLETRFVIITSEVYVISLNY